MDLNKIVNETLTKLQEEKYVEQVVEKRLKETIDSVVKDVFGSYTDFSKQMKEEVQEQLQVNFKELGLAEYNHMVLGVVKDLLHESVHTQGLEQLTEGLEKLLGTEKKEYKLSEIIDQLKEEGREDDGDELDGESVSLHVDNSSRLYFIYFDAKPGVKNYSCKYRIVVNDGVITAANVEEKSYTPKTVMGGLYGLEADLFKAYVTGSKFIVDEDDCEVEYGYSDED